MFNLGFSEIVVLAVIGLLVLGPKQLPEVARKLARILNELKRATDEALKPMNEMKDQAQHYIAKSRDEINLQQQKLDQSIENISQKKPETPPEDESQ